MKARKRRTDVAVTSGSRQQNAMEREISNFLLALHSYPERFAIDPCLSFEQHLFSTIAAGSPALAGEINRRN